MDAVGVGDREQRALSLGAIAGREADHMACRQRHFGTMVQANSSLRPLCRKAEFERHIAQGECLHTGESHGSIQEHAAAQPATCNL